MGLHRRAGESFFEIQYNDVQYFLPATISISAAEQ